MKALKILLVAACMVFIQHTVSAQTHFDSRIGIGAKAGMTLTDAFNTFIQQSLNVEGLPFIVTKNSKEALKEQAIAMLMLDLKRAEERADVEGWIDADDLERELGVLD